MSLRIVRLANFVAPASGGCAPPCGSSAPATGPPGTNRSWSSPESG